MFSIFKKISWFIKIYKKKYILAIFLIALSYIFFLVPPWMIGVLTDKIKERTITLPELYTQLLLLLGAIVMSYIINYFWSYYLFMGSDQMRRDTRRRLMKKFLGQSPVFFEKNSTGSLMGKSTNDVSALGDFAGFGFMSLVDATLLPLVVILIMAFSVSAKMTFFSILPLPLLIVFTKKFEDKITEHFEASQKTFDRMNDKVLENVSGVRVIRSYVRENYEKESFAEVALENYEKNMLFQRVITYFPAISRLIPGLSFVIALLVGAYYIKSGEVTIGKFISFTIYLDMLVWPMFAFGEFITVSEQASTAMDRIQALFDYPEDVPIDQGTEPYGGGGDIAFIDYSFRYPSSTQAVLDHVSFELKHGQTLGVVGKIGSGKTTLVKQLLHLYPVTPNALWLGGHPIEHYQVQSVRSHIGYVPQQHVLFSKSIKDNVLLGQQHSDEAALWPALEKADFIKDLAQLPHGIDTMTGEKGIALSGGQKQRISIARALINDPDILILDDSLSAVDATTEANILKAIQAHRAGKTNVITAHRLSAIAHADLILVLEEGRVIQKGVHATLFEEEGWYREQFLHQQLGGDDYEE